MFTFFSKTSIRTRLLWLAGMSAALIAVIIVTNRLTDRKVDLAYQSIDSAQQTIQTARDAIDTSGRLKDDIYRVQQQAAQLRLIEKTFLQFHQAGLKDKFEQLASQMTSDAQKLNLTGVIAEFQEYRKAFLERVALQVDHDTLNRQMTEPLQVSAERLDTIQKDLESKQALKQMDGGRLSDDEMEMMNVARDCKIIFLKLQNLQQLFVSSGDQKYVEEYKVISAGDATSGIRSLREFANALHNTNYLDSSKTITASLGEFQKFIEKSLTVSARESELEQQLDTRGNAILQAAATQLARADETVLAQKGKVQTATEQMQVTRAAATGIKESAATAILIIMLVGAVAYSGAFLKIIASINRSLRVMISELSHEAGQTTAAAHQISTSSQNLAEGASEQAASIEETSASLEELSSMTKRNAENAQQANELAKQARFAADKGVGDMESMNTAMAAIKMSSDDIAKIIKTIDEIAFQTNILALNAAVEAARAGEAGMGFAVVADEVRNLAQRSATAAKETASKIEGAIGKTAQGVEISRKVAETLNEIVIKARQVDELAAEVASASREQTQGINQINAAVGQVDKVTQSNAANAEESAAAAEELTSQAELMNKTVAELLQLVGGALDENKKNVPTGSVQKNSGTGHGHRRTLDKVASPAGNRPQRRLETLPEQDFKRF